LEFRGVCIIGCSATGSKLEWSRCPHWIGADEPNVNGLVAAGAAKAEGGAPAPPPFPAAGAGAVNAKLVSGFVVPPAEQPKQLINYLLINEPSINLIKLIAVAESQHIPNEGAGTTGAGAGAAGSEKVKAFEISPPPFQSPN